MADIAEIPVSPAAAQAAPATDATISTETPIAVAPAASIEAAVSSTEAKPAEVVAEPAKVEASIESVLGAEIKPAESVATEKKDAPEAKPEGEKAATVETPAEVKTELPVYEPFKLPENVNLEKEGLDTFTKILGEIETGKLDHIGMQAKGQELIDLATKATTDSINRLNDYYVQINEQNKKARFAALKADPDLGGDKLPETISTLQRSVIEYGGTVEQIAEFRKEVSENGIDASPSLCRLIYNMQQKINEYTTEGDENRMVPGAKPAPSKVRDYQRFYTAN